MHLKYRQTCRVCGNPHLKDVIDLGDQFLQGSFVKEGLTKPSLRKIPTKLVRCDASKDERGCGLVQMSVTVPPAMLYQNYWYASSVSQTMRDHLAGIVQEIGAIFNRAERVVQNVMDVASNDGCLLRAYPDHVNKWGVDPSDIARKVEMPNCTIINDLFPTPKLRPEGSFDAISTVAMFYDIEDPVVFVREIAGHLADHGIWVVEVAYLPATLKQVSLDTAVHEHLMYYSLATLEHVIKAGGLRVFRAELNSINGGSIQVYCSKVDCTIHDRPEWTEALGKLRTAEFDLKLDTEEPYDLFRNQCEVTRHKLRNLIIDIRARGEKVFLYGSSTKANTLLQYVGLDHNDIPYALERSEAKWGARTLGTDIQIISEAEGWAMEPDYVLVGPWHFRDEILRRERDTINGTGGRKPVKFIFPLPTIEVVSHVPEVAA